MNREQLESIAVAVPGFRETWEKFLEQWRTEASPPWYLAMAELAHYVVESYAQRRTAEFPDLFAAIEVVLQNPNPELESLITVGLFEDIQNIASHRDFGFAVFRQWLGPRSLIVWEEVDAYMQKVCAWARRQEPERWQFWRRRKRFDAAKALAQVENKELKKVIESNYRKMR